VDGTGLGLCVIIGSEINSVELSGSATEVSLISFTLGLRLTVLNSQVLLLKCL